MNYLYLYECIFIFIYTYLYLFISIIIIIFIIIVYYYYLYYYIYYLYIYMNLYFHINVSHWIHLYEIWYSSVFPKFVEEIQCSLKSDKSKVTLHGDQFPFCIIFRSVLLKMRNVSEKCIQKIKTRFMFNIFFPRKSYRLWDNAKKYCRGGQARWRYGTCTLRAG